MNRTVVVAGLVLKEIFRKKDFYVAIILTAVILLYASSLNFYGVGGASRYLRDLGLALIYAFSAILVVPLAARQYPSEMRERTLGVLLAKPLHRREFIAGKFLGSAVSGVACFLIFYGGFLVIASIKAGPPDAVTALETAILFSMSLMMLAALATGLSFYMTVGANVSVSLVLFGLMTLYGPALREAGGGLGAVFYYLLPHFELFDMRQRLVHDLGPVSPVVLAALALYAGTYTAIFLLAGWSRFKRTVL